MGCPALNHPEVLPAVYAGLESFERKKSVLDSLLNSGRVSSVAYDEINRELLNIIGKMKDLKESLELEEKSFYNSYSQEKILERTRATLEFRYISGEITSAEWERMKTTLALGLESIKNPTALYTKPSNGLDTLDFVINEKIENPQLETSEKSIVKKNSEVIYKLGNLSEEKKEKTEKIKKKHVKTRSREKIRERLIKSKAEIKGGSIHCRNPWNGECKNTDIELSIYYKGEYLPICRECWQEISEKNLEW